MRGAVDAKALTSAVKAVQGLVARANTIPILRCVRLSAGGGALTIESTNLEQRASISIRAELSDGTAVVEPDRLLTVLSAIRGGAQISLAGQMLSVSGKGSRADILSLPAKDWPEWTRNDDVGSSFEIDATSFLLLLSAVSPATSQDASNYYLQGVNLRWRDNWLYAEATNRHLLMGVGAHQCGNAYGYEPVIIPTKFIGLAGKIVPDGPATLAVSQSSITISTETVRVTSKLIDGTFPNADRIIPKQPKPVLRADRGSLLNAINAAQRFCLLDKDGFRCVVIDGCAVTAQGNAGEIFRAEFDGEAIQQRPISINSAYVASALGALTSETVTLSDEDAGSPMVFEGAGVDCCIVMPMSLPAWFMRQQKEAA